MQAWAMGYRANKNIDEAIVNAKKARGKCTK